MKLIKQTISSMPLVGWTPAADTIYIVTDVYGKVYIPIPSTPKMAMMHTRPSMYQSNLYLELMRSDDIYIGGSAVGNYPIEIEYLTANSPYVVRFTTPNDTYIATMYDSLDTVADVLTSSAVNPVAVCHTQGQALKKLSPSYFWTFNEQYDTTSSSYYVDDVSHVKLTVSGGNGIYPSPMDDLAYRAWHCPTGHSGVTQVVHATSLTYYSIVVWASAEADCVLLATDKLEIAVDGGMLKVTIDGFTHTTAFNMVGVAYAPVQGVFPLHKVFLIVEESKLSIVVDNLLVVTVVVPLGVSTALSPITILSIPESTCDRTYACLAVIPTHVPLQEALCTAMQPFVPLSRNIPIAASNCSVYSIRRWTGESITASNRLSINEISEQGTVCLKILATDDAVATITYAVTEDRGRSYFVPVYKDTVHVEHIWLDKGAAVHVTVAPASATISAYSIGEH